MKKVLIVLIMIFCVVFLFSCDNFLNNENDEVSATIDILWKLDTDYIYYAVYNDGDVPINSFYIVAKVKYSDNIFYGRQFGEKDCSIDPGELYSGFYNIAKEGKTIESVEFANYELNNTEWDFE